MSEPILKIKNVTREYLDEHDNKIKVEALKNINFEVFKGEFLSIIGSSGCGKTTLLRLIGGLDNPQKGEILINGKKINGPDFKRGYIFQQGNLFSWLTVEQNIAFGLKARHVYKEEKYKIPEFIKMIGLSGFENSYPHQIKRRNGSKSCYSAFID